jgi:hypothetical protein
MCCGLAFVGLKVGDYIALLAAGFPSLCLVS